MLTDKNGSKSVTTQTNQPIIPGRVSLVTSRDPYATTKETKLKIVQIERDFFILFLNSGQMCPMFTRAFRRHAACIVFVLKLFESFAEGAGSVKLRGDFGAGQSELVWPRGRLVSRGTSV